MDIGKAEALNEFFASISAGSLASHLSCVPTLLGGGCGSKIPPSVREEHMRLPDEIKCARARGGLIAPIPEPQRDRPMQWPRCSPSHLMSRGYQTTPQ